MHTVRALQAGVKDCDQQPVGVPLTFIAVEAEDQQTPVRAPFGCQAPRGA